MIVSWTSPQTSVVGAILSLLDVFFYFHHNNSDCNTSHCCILQLCIGNWLHWRQCHHHCCQVHHRWGQGQGWGWGWYHQGHLHPAVVWVLGKGGGDLHHLLSSRHHSGLATSTGLMVSTGFLASPVSVASGCAGLTGLVSMNRLLA